MDKHAVFGSERQPYLDAKPVADADPNERLEVTLVLRHSAEAQFGEIVSQALSAENRQADRAELQKRLSASPEDIAAVKTFADEYGLTVEAVDADRRTVILSGTVKQFSAAFGVKLQNFKYSGGTYRGRTGAVHVPSQLKDIVHAVMGLDNRPQARPHFRVRQEPSGVRPRAGTPPSSFTPLQIAQIYGFPPGKADGQCIGIIELGGGYNDSDLREYFGKLGVSPAPQVVSIPVAGATNAPTGDPNGPDGEVMLDIEVAGAIASAAKIAVYFAPNTDAGFLNAIATAIHDDANKPSVVSISWGGPESEWTVQAMNVYDGTFQAAAAMGITITVASGDNGSTDGVGDGRNHVDFPASSPHVLACGGTTLHASNGSITDEVVWNETANREGATGGGVSSQFKLPSWQNHLHVKTTSGERALKNRGVPDVSGDADPETGYTVRVDGVDTVIGGTSAVAPLWAALIAILNGSGSNVGFIPPMLYGDPGALHDITSGNNGAYVASPGWDACTGLGTPNGPQLATMTMTINRGAQAPKVATATTP